jgi:hypothetical protein
MEVKRLSFTPTQAYDIIMKILEALMKVVDVITTVISKMA